MPIRVNNDPILDINHFIINFFLHLATLKAGAVNK